MHLPLKDLIEKKKKVNAINCLIVNYGCKLKKIWYVKCVNFVFAPSQLVQNLQYDMIQKKLE